MLHLSRTPRRALSCATFLTQAALEDARLNFTKRGAVAYHTGALPRRSRELPINKACRSDLAKDITEPIRSWHRS